MRAAILRGDPVVRDIERWCLRHGHEDGVEPVLAVLFFNTDVAAEHYVQIKAKVAAQAGVGYWVYEMPPNASPAEVQAEIRRLNKDNTVHGILIQRPLPEHLDEPKIMASVSPAKSIEEYREGRTDNIAADAFARLLAKYGKLDTARRSTIHVAGFGNIITDGFIAHMRDRYPFVSVTPHLPPRRGGGGGKASPGEYATTGPGKDRQHSVLVTELHQGPGYITLDRIPSDVRVIIDFGFYATEKGGIVGDVDHTVYEEGAGLAIAPTPGGLLPVLLWLMMERTIRAKRILAGRKLTAFCACQ